MSSNRLKLNTDKTQFIWLGSRQQLQKVSVNAVHLGTDVVNFQTTVGTLGVTIDSQMTMTAHVRRICRTSFYQLRQLRTVRRSLSSEAFTALVHAFVTNRLDYCLVILYCYYYELKILQCTLQHYCIFYKKRLFLYRPSVRAHDLLGPVA